jgi:hypothetical protein
MMPQTETIYYISNNKLIREVENDGHAFMRRGSQTRRYVLCDIEEAKLKYPEELSKAIVIPDETISDN